MPSWMYFVLALAGLLGGYFVYGSIVEKVFGPNPNRPTPACKMPDGVDYVEMKQPHTMTEPNFLKRLHH